MVRRSDASNALKELYSKKDVISALAIYGTCMVSNDSPIAVLLRAVTTATYQIVLTASLHSTRCSSVDWTESLHHRTSAALNRLK